jgi:hypothetical protein
VGFVIEGGGMHVERFSYIIGVVGVEGKGREGKGREGKGR